MSETLPTEYHGASEEFFIEPYLEARVDNELKAIVYKWKGYIRDEEAMTGMRRLLDMVKQSKAVNLLADLTAFAGGSVEMAKWIDRIWSAQLKEAGVKNLAIILPISSVGEYTNTLALGPHAAQNLNSKLFDSEQKAAEWLRIVSR